MVHIKFAPYLLITCCCVYSPLSFGDSTLCLKTEGIKQASYLQMNLPDDALHTGTVKYKSGNGVIKIKHLSKDHFISQNKDNQAVTVSQWQEVIDSHPSGIYSLYSYKANVVKLVYINHAHTKMIEFVDDPDAYSSNGCQWGDAE